MCRAGALLIPKGHYRIQRITMKKILLKNDDFEKISEIFTLAVEKDRKRYGKLLAKLFDILEQHQNTNLVFVAEIPNQYLYGAAKKGHKITGENYTIEPHGEHKVIVEIYDESILER